MTIARCARRALALAFLLAATPAPRAHAAAATADVLIVVGAPGTPEYAAAFAEAARAWQKAAGQGGAQVVVLGLDGGAERPLLQGALARQAAAGPTPLWLVLLGHGTFDGKHARFNLRGPDVSASDLKDQLARFSRPLIIINTAPASAPFVSTLSGRDRTVIAATRSGSEQNATRLPRALAAALTDSGHDLDKDGQVSLLEAFLGASRAVGNQFTADGLLATEHAILDDNGDARGTPTLFFKGLRPDKTAEDGSLPDGTRAHQVHLVPTPADRDLSPAQRKQRDALELQLAQLRATRARLGDATFYRRVEPLLLELARIYQP